jgi:hypothetical protein
MVGRCGNRERSAAALTRGKNAATKGVGRVVQHSFLSVRTQREKGGQDGPARGRVPTKGKRVVGTDWRVVRCHGERQWCAHAVGEVRVKRLSWVVL